MSHSSRIPHFYKLTVAERQAAILNITAGQAKPRGDAVEILGSGGLDVEAADKIVENVIGTYALPFGVALNAIMNNEDRLIPMAVEEPSVIAAASNACKMIRAGGGFTAKMRESLMTAQIELRNVSNLSDAKARLESNKSQLLKAAAAAVPRLVARGGGPKDWELRTIGPDHLVVHLFVDCQDAMGANLVNTSAEAIGQQVADIAGAKLGLRILSNLCDRRVAEVTVRVPRAALQSRHQSQTACTSSDDVLDAIEAASVFAERDPYRAATHNKGFMNGVDSVVIATGNDYRAVEAGAHAFASKSGSYRPLATWKKEGDELVGAARLPLALGIVGGTLRVHPGARLALEISGAKSADDLALLAACAGLASNLAALRALSTEGIQRGHMSLHARSVASAAGAKGIEIDQVAALIAADGDVSISSATNALATVRDSSTPNKP